MADPGTPAPGVPVLGGDELVPEAARSFRVMARDTARQLAGMTRFDLCFVSRYAEDRLTLVGVQANGITAAEGQQIAYSDTLCSRMVSRLAPPVIPRLWEAPAVAELAITRTLALKSYAGAPLLGPQGELLGTVCGMGRQELRTDPIELYHFLMVRGAVLSSLLSSQLQSAVVERADDRSDAALHAGKATNLPDRAGWGLLLAREERRCRDSVDSAAVVVLAVDAVRGHRKLRLVASAICELFAQRGGAVAHLEGRQFAVLMPGCTTDDAAAATYEIVEDLSLMGLAVHAGWATRQEAGNLQQAWTAAEARLLASRRAMIRK